MTTQNMLIPNVSANDGFAGSAIGLQDNAANNISGLYAGSFPCWVWMRFEITDDIAIGSTIDSLILRVDAAETDSGTTWETDIVLNKVAAADNPTTYADLIAKAYTAGTRFTNTSITSGTYVDFDITAEGQELIDDTAIATGDYVLVAMKFVTGTTADRTLYSRDNGTSTDPELNWTYSDPPAGGSGPRKMTLLGVG